MKTLSILFNEERERLQSEIDKATNIEQVVKLLQNRLDNFEKNYINQLNVAQVRLASFFMDALRQSLVMLAVATISQIDIPEQKPIAEEAIAFSPNKLILKLLQGLIFIGILGSLFSLTKTAPGAWMAILLTLLLLGLEVVFQLNKEDNLSSPQLVKSPQPTLRVESKILLENLGDALHTIDLAVARVEEWNKPKDDRALEDLPELLNFLQRLMGTSFLDRPQMTSELVKLLPQILIEQGIRTQIYQSQDPRNNREYFDFEPSIDPSTQDYVTIAPALLKGDRLLRRGRVIEPAYSEVQES
ncbi:hypothetical protein HC931_05225 [Candidatus Gracilibacteria bacterium]|nr:hypothetical protein [Candidatus Gracilibacteria bacterium]NJM88605.1 hypothetical protein [Hydrococcus sp. RU_2_2]NJP18244.1 hypothetical protein [Hydrococcus sp. CRU_1_1]